MKIVFCLTRLSSLTAEAFQEYWFNVHGPLVEKHKKVLRIARYVQVHTIAGGMSDKLRGFRESPEPYDGVAEIWYESAAALQSLGRDPAARAASRELREDEARFVDLARSPIWIGEERTIL